MAQQIDERHQQRKNKQNMDEVTGEVKPPTEKPENDQDRKEGPKHRRTTSKQRASSYSG